MEVVVNMVGPSGRSPKFSGITDTHMLLLGIPLDLGSPAFIHRKFRGLPAFEPRKTSPLHVRVSRWLRWLG